MSDLPNFGMGGLGFAAPSQERLSRAEEILRRYEKGELVDITLEAVTNKLFNQSEPVDHESELLALRAKADKLTESLAKLIRIMERDADDFSGCEDRWDRGYASASKVYSRQARDALAEYRGEGK